MRRNKRKKPRGNVAFCKKSMFSEKNYTTPNNRLANINKSNPRYSHLSEDSINFLRHCERIGANPILRSIGKPTEFEMRPFMNGDPQYPDYYCVRHLATLSNRQILTNWSLYQVKDKGYLLQVNDFNNPVFFYHLVYADLSEIADAFVAPSALITDAKQALQKMPTEEPTTEEPTEEPKPMTEEQFQKHLDSLTSADAPSIPEPTDCVLDYLKPTEGRDKVWQYSPDYW